MVQNRRTNQDRQAVYDPSKRDRILLISTISPTSSQHYSTFKPGFNAAERRLRATATALGEKAGGASVIHYIYVLSHPQNPFFAAMFQKGSGVTPWMEIIHERINAGHERMKAIHERIKAVHGRMKTIHGFMKAVNGFMKAIHGRMKAGHRRMEAIHGRMEAVHGRTGSILDGKVLDTELLTN